MISRLLVVLLSVVSLAPLHAATLSIKDGTFQLDGKPFKPWGVRTASAAITDEYTTSLIAQLDDYKAHGVNSVTVFYEGSSGGFMNPFSPDGTTIDPLVEKRMEQIISEADKRRMVVVAGIFYQFAPHPVSADALRNSVVAVTKALQPFRNVIINVSNEQNSGKWKDFAPVFDMRVPENVAGLCKLVKATDPQRIVGSGGYDSKSNEEIGRSPDVDVLLFDTSHTDEDSAKLYDRYVKAGVTGKPMINVETFGGSTKPYLPPGVFNTPENEKLKAAYLREIAAVAPIPHLGLFLHNNPWFQGAKKGDKLHFEIGGNGDPTTPGFSWYFDAVKAASSLPVPQPAPAPAKTP